MSSSFQWRDELKNLEPMFGSRDEFKDTVFLNIAQLLGVLSTCPRGAVGAVIVRDGRAISWGFNGAPAGMPHCEENHHGYTHEMLAGCKIIIDQMVYDIEEAKLVSPSDWQTSEPEEYVDIVPIILENAARKFGCRNVTHAEANALAYAARQGISTDGATLYCELSPCVNCARLLLAAGITRAVFATEYRDAEGINILRRGGVDIG